ncbi:MAG: DUF4256 domain-containing protein [Chitinophagaceae bacterium]|nr:DUF4256 domain-containing protein [Chitinophagaceae bacterium]
MKKELTKQNKLEILKTLKERFEQNKNRHRNIDWINVQAKLEDNPLKLRALHSMERTGGEPDVVDFNKSTNEYIFIDCSKESPAGRRSLCYDREGLDSRKAHKPAANAIDTAGEIGITILTEEQYKKYHRLTNFDSKTSSWVLTPKNIRDLGGALFCDFRFGRVFTYHNGAESYYAARGFRGILIV